MKSTTVIAIILACLVAPGCRAGRPSAPGTDGTGGSAGLPPPAPFVAATDPSQGADPCAGYALDGVGLRMTRAQLERTIPLQRVPPQESSLSAFKDTTWAFRARRPGRIDDVQVGFASEEADAPAQRVRARILVGPSDVWPTNLFETLGSPKRARVGEWIWWNETCRATIRLSLVESLGGGPGQPYILELMETATSP